MMMYSSDYYPVDRKSNGITILSSKSSRKRSYYEDEWSDESSSNSNNMNINMNINKNKKNSNNYPSESSSDNDSQTNKENTNITSHQSSSSFFYEQLGAPVILYKPKKSKPGISQYDINGPIDTSTTEYRPQPWGYSTRRKDDDKHHQKFMMDSNYIWSTLIKADRLRIRYFSDKGFGVSTIPFQPTHSTSSNRKSNFRYLDWVPTPEPIQFNIVPSWNPKPKKGLASSNDSSSNQHNNLTLNNNTNNTNSNSNNDTSIIGCTCKKSKCLKLYCQCFAGEAFCSSDICRCLICKNTSEHMDERNNAISTILQRNTPKKPKSKSKPTKKTTKTRRIKNRLIVPKRGRKNSLESFYFHRIELMNSSAREGYTTPFTHSGILYGLGYKRLSKKMDTTDVLKKKKSIELDDDDDENSDHDDDNSDDNEDDNDMDNKCDNVHTNVTKKFDTTTTTSNFEYHEGIGTKKIPKCLKGLIPRTYIEKPESIGDSPATYGNCLLLIPTPFPSSLSSVGEDQSSPNNSQDNHYHHDYKSSDNLLFLIHPAGNTIITSSEILLPMDDSYDIQSSDTMNTNNMKSKVAKAKRCFYKKFVEQNNYLDVGGKILQLSPLFDVHKYSTGSDSTFDNTHNGRECVYDFIVRTPTHCSYIKFITKLIWTQTGLNNQPSIYRVKRSFSEVSRINLKCEKDGSTYEPLHITSCINSSSCQNIDPFFAILSRKSITESYEYKNTNVIHIVRMRRANFDVKPTIEKHVISDLEDISIIEFSRKHPMILWAAASKINPISSSKIKLERYNGGAHKRPMMGYGHNLYSIDLRTNKATFIWSSSHAEFMVDNLLSLSSILPDQNNVHVVHVSSLSGAGKMWKLDTRVPSQPLCVWTLPGLCEDIGATSMYGYGMIPSIPFREAFSRDNCISFPILYINKNPGSLGLHLYQEPTSLPRFATNPLEIPGGKAIAGSLYENKTSFASSNIYSLPDTSSGNFMIGLVSFYVSISHILEEPTRLNYRITPNSALCSITMTSTGAIILHTFLQCNGDMDMKSIEYEGLPTGSNIVPVPKGCEGTIENDFIYSEPKSLSHFGALRLYLSNIYPAPGHAINNHNVVDRSECRPFETLQLKHLPNYIWDECEDNTHDEISLHHLKPMTVLSCNSQADCQKQDPLLLPSPYFKDYLSIVEKRALPMLNVFPKQTPTEGDQRFRSDLSNNVISRLKKFWSSDSKN